MVCRQAGFVLLLLCWFQRGMPLQERKEHYKQMLRNNFVELNYHFLVEESDVRPKKEV